MNQHDNNVSENKYYCAEKSSNLKREICNRNVSNRNGGKAISEDKSQNRCHGHSSVGSTGSSSNNKKDKFSNGIFTFLQKFRSNRSKTFCHEKELLQHFGFPDNRRSLAIPRCRPWTSIESVLSTATTSSFSFIPADKLRSSTLNVYPKELDVTDFESNCYAQRLLRNAPVDKAVTLRTKYNLYRTNSGRHHSTRRKRTNGAANQRGKYFFFFLII